MRACGVTEKAFPNCTRAIVRNISPKAMSTSPEMRIASQGGPEVSYTRNASARGGTMVTTRARRSMRLHIRTAGRSGFNDWGRPGVAPFRFACRTVEGFLGFTDRRMLKVIRRAQGEF